MNDLLPALTNLIAVEESIPEPGWMIFVYVALVIAVIFGLLFQMKQGLGDRVFKNPVTQWAEHLYCFLESFAVGIIGPHGRKYLPILATFWLWIFVANVLGLFLPHTPTADFSINLGLAITAVLYVQYEGIRTNGLGGHLKHFAGPKLTGAMVIVSGMIFLIEFISEAMKMVSLPLRLYGNIHGGHEVVKNLNELGHIGDFANLPVGALLLPIKILTCLVQALVFVLLLCVYLGLVTHHEGEEDHDTHSERGLEPAHH